MKQTAVEWLANEIITRYDKSFLEFYGSEIALAKEMEKQQIIDAYDKGSDVDEELKPLYGKPEQYYNETFKNKQDEKRKT